MYYDTNDPRWAHLKGLTNEQIALVMLLADMAVREAHGEQNNIPR